MQRIDHRWIAVIVLIAVILGPASLVRASVAIPETNSSKVAQGTVPRFEPGECPEKIKPNIPPGEAVRCGTLFVPERYDSPGGKMIELDVLIIPAVTETVAPDPVIFAQGGPGGSTIDYYSQVLFNSRIRGNRDFVLFDQRGTQFSRPSLFCQEIYDEGIRTLEMDLRVEESERLFREAALACRDRLAAEGINLSAYNSIENARDIESLRQALGYARINLYGVSYGTLLALHAMREVPDALRSVILDAVVPTDIDFNFDAPNSQNRAFSELFDTCAVDPECSQAFPNLEGYFFDLVERLNAKPVFITLTDGEDGKTYRALLDGDALVDALFQMMYVAEFIPLLPRMIHNTARGDYAFLESIFSLIVFDRGVNYGMYYSVVCSEDGIEDPGYTYDGIRPEIGRDIQIENASMVELCKAWEVEQIGRGADEPVTSDIPTLILNGRFDPITPPAYGIKAAKTLSRAYVFTFPNSAHGALNTSKCADDIFLEFLSKPQVQPDGTCLTELGGPDFITNRDVINLPVMMKLATMNAQIGWQLGAFGIAILGMASALVVFPLAWLVRRARGRAERPTPGLVYLASWLPIFNSGALVALSGGIFAVLMILSQEQDYTALYFGLPARFGILFALPIFSLVLTIALVVYVAAGWRGKYWSLARKLYFTFLSICSLVSAVLLGMWGFFFV
jgi:pimeloyl-ACP methyl ester carboxylesterase